MFILKILSVLLCLSVLESSVVPESHRDYPYIKEESNRLDTFASILSSSFNTDVNPCDNYFKYIATGDRDKISELLHPNVGSVDIYTLYDQFLANATDLTDAEKQVKIFFESCMNIKDDKFEDAIKNLDIRNNVGNFPALDAAWTEDQFDWTDMEAKFGLAGSPVFLDSEPFLEDGLWSVNVKLAPKYLFLTFHKEDKYEKVFKPFGLDDDAIATLKSEMSDLEKHFSNVPDADEFKVVTIDYLKEQVPEFDWEDYLKKVIGKDIKSLGKIYLYIDNIEDLKNRFKIGSSNKKHLAHFYFMRLIADLHLEYNYVKALKPSSCNERVIDHFPDIFASIILKQRVDEHDREHILLVIESIFQQITDENERKAISTEWNELKDFQQIIGTKEEFSKKIENSYKNLQLSTDDYLLNVLKSLHENATRHQNSLLSYRQSRNIIQTGYVLHGQPRLLYALKIGLDLFSNLKEKFDYSETFKSQTDFCQAILTQKIDLLGVLNLVESLSLTDSNKYLNEVETLKKYDLTQTKFIFAAFTMAGDLASTTKFNENEQKIFSDVLFTFKQLTDEYECEVVDPVSRMGQSCKL